MLLEARLYPPIPPTPSLFCDLGILLQAFYCCTRSWNCGHENKPHNWLTMLPHQPVKVRFSTGPVYSSVPSLPSQRQHQQRKNKRCAVFFTSIPPPSNQYQKLCLQAPTSFPEGECEFDKSHFWSFLFPSVLETNLLDTHATTKYQHAGMDRDIILSI